MHSRASRGNPSPRLPCRSLAYGRFAPMASRCSSQARKPAPQRGAGGLAAAPRSAFAPRVPRVARRSPPPSLVPVPGALRPARPRVAPGFSGLRALACSCAVPARAPEAFGSGVPSLLACGGLSLGRFAPGARRGAFVAPRRFPTSPLVVLLSQRLHKRARLNCTGFARPCLLLSL